MAAPCQGDVDCKKSDTRSIVTYGCGRCANGCTRRPLWKSCHFCSLKESVVFSCSTGTKNGVGVRLARSIAEKGTVSYRFGTPQVGRNEYHLNPSRRARARSMARPDAFAGAAARGCASPAMRTTDVVCNGHRQTGQSVVPSPRRPGVSVSKNGRTHRCSALQKQGAERVRPAWGSRAGIVHRQEGSVPD